MNSIFINIKVGVISIFSLTLLSVCSWGNILDSCKYEVRGIILDAETQKPIFYATVKIENLTRGTTTDDQGRFVISNVCDEEFNLICSYLGYKTVIHHHDAHHHNPVILMANDASQLESIVVEGEQLVGDVESMALEKVSKTTLSQSAATSLGESITKVSGVSLVSSGYNAKIPAIHGLYGNRILIINDGFKHGFQNWGTDHAPEINVSTTDNVEVLKGASTVRFGPEALGGVILVNGASLKLSNEFYGHVNNSFETNGRGGNINIDFGKGYNRISYHIASTYTKIGDRHTPGYSLTNTGKVEKGMNMGFRFHMPKWDFTARYGYFDQNLGRLRSSIFKNGDDLIRAIDEAKPILIEDFSYDIGAPNQQAMHHFASGVVDWHSPIGEVSLKFGKQLNIRKEFDVRRNIGSPITHLNLETEDIQLDWKHALGHGKHGIFGLQYFAQDNDNVKGTQTAAFIPNYNIDRFSAYIIESMHLGDNTYEVGLRADTEHSTIRRRLTSTTVSAYEYNFTNVTASFGLVHKFSGHTSLRSNVGSSWRSPNVAELYSFGQHGFKSQYGLWRYTQSTSSQFSTDKVLTKEEAGTKAERGYKWISELTIEKRTASLSLSGHVNYIKNYIIERPITVIGTLNGPMPAFIYDQVDALLAGGDLTYLHVLSKDFKGRLAASYLWSKNVAKGEALINQASPKISYELTWETPDIGGLRSSSFKVEPSYTFRQWRAPRVVSIEDIVSGSEVFNSQSQIFDFVEAPDGYFLLDLGWYWKKRHVEGSIVVKNVLNTSYRDYLNQMRYFAEELGRNFLFTINYKL